MLHPLRSVRTASSTPLLFGCLLLGLVTSACAQTPEPPTAAPRLDGKIGAHEWTGAIQHALTEEGTVLAKWSAGDLYLALRSEGDGWAHVYIAEGDTLRIFHASAALGTAIYVQQASGFWDRTAAFDWAVRDTSFTPEAEAARAAFFTDHGWIASTQMMGTTGVIELRISAARLAGDAPRLAVAFAEDPAQPRYWPSSVTGGALDARLVRGDPPATLDFEPARWAELDATR